MRQALRHHRHGEGDGKIHFRAAFDRAPPRFPKIGAAKEVLASELDAVELQIKLEPAVIETAAQLFGERGIVRDPDAIRVQEQIIDPRIFPGPPKQLEKLRMQRRFAAGELENFDPAFAIDHALDPALQISERDGVHISARAHGRVRVASGAGEIARVHDLDEREAGGKFLERRVAFSPSIAPESAAHGAVACPARGAATVSVLGIPRIALREPVKARIGTDVDFRHAMLLARATQKDFGFRPAHSPHLRRTRRLTDRATADRALEQSLNWQSAGGEFHSSGAGG